MGGEISFAVYRFELPKQAQSAQTIALQEQSQVFPRSVLLKDRNLGVRSQNQNFGAVAYRIEDKCDGDRAKPGVVEDHGIQHVLLKFEAT